MHALAPEEEALMWDLLGQVDLAREDVVDVIELGRSTNAVFAIIPRTGPRLVLRVYGNAGWSEEYDRARLRKEEHLHEVLHDHGIRVPHFIATLDRGDEQAALMSFVEGQTLRELLTAHPDQADLLWRECGQALARIHTVCPGSHAGEILGEDLQHFVGSSGPIGWGTHSPPATSSETFNA